MHILSGRSSPEKKQPVCICVNIYYRKPDNIDMETEKFNIFCQQAGDLGEPVVWFYPTFKTEERILSASLKTV